MKLSTILAALAFVLLVTLAGSQTGCATDPNTGKVTVDPALVTSTVDDVADLAESYVILFVDPADQPRILAEIDLARKAADLPALKRLLARLQQQHDGTAPATQPAQ